MSRLDWLLLWRYTNHDGHFLATQNRLTKEGTMSYEESIKNCNFLLSKQKNMVLELYSKEEVAEGAEGLVDYVLEKVLGFGLGDLTATEQMEVTNAIKDYV